MKKFSSTSLWVAAGLVLASAGALAPANAVTLSEGTFASNTYHLTPTNSSAGDFIGVGQCNTCGNPDFGLRFFSISPSSTSGNGDLGVVLDTLSYDTAAGAIGSITASVSKNLTFSTAVSSTSTFRPLIEEGGIYYLAAIPLANVNGTTSGYQNASASLTADDFLQYNFSTGVSGTSHPDFSSGILNFGIGQIFSNIAGETAFADYDNLTFNVASVGASAVPEPGSWLLLIGGFGLVGATMRRARRSNQDLATPKLSIVQA